MATSPALHVQSVTTPETPEICAQLVSTCTAEALGPPRQMAAALHAAPSVPARPGVTHETCHVAADPPYEGPACMALSMFPAPELAPPEMATSPALQLHSTTFGVKRETEPQVLAEAMGGPAICDPEDDPDDDPDEDPEDPEGDAEDVPELEPLEDSEGVPEESTFSVAPTPSVRSASSRAPESTGRTSSESKLPLQPPDIPEATRTTPNASHCPRRMSQARRGTHCPVGGWVTRPALLQNGHTLSVCRTFRGHAQAPDRDAKS
jgi:hypothetical protein